MKQLEIVELRCMNPLQDTIQCALDELLESSKTDSAEGDMRIYRHTTVETDVSIHIHHERAETLEGGSPLGFQLASFLRTFGLVNHDVWTLIELSH